jgi:hypothetical protein
MRAYEYEIGKPFVSGVVRWPEHDAFTVPEAGRGYQLCLYQRAPTGATASAIRDGAGDLAVAYLSGVLFLLYRFDGEAARGSRGWSAVAYTRGGYGSTPRSIPGAAPANGGGRAADPDTTSGVLSVFVVNADTGMLRGMRRVALPPEMAARLNAAVRDEDAKPFHGDHLYHREVARARSPYPSDKAMLAHALASCHFDHQADSSATAAASPLPANTTRRGEETADDKN